LGDSVPNHVEAIYSPPPPTSERTSLMLGTSCLGHHLTDHGAGPIGDCKRYYHYEVALSSYPQIFYLIIVNFISVSNMKVEEAKKIGVLGAGVMGSQITQVCATFGFNVITRDIGDSILKDGMNQIIEGPFGLRRGVERGKLTKEQMDDAIKRIKMTTDMDKFCREADVIIEAAPEDLSLKIKIFRELDEKCPKRTILSTNSSGFTAAPLAGATKRPDKVVVMHWFNPAPIMRLVEIVRTPQTSDETVEVIKGIAEKCNKVTIVAKDDPRGYGYVANRCYGAMVREAMRLIDSGICTSEDVDKALKFGYNFPMGPFEMFAFALRGASWEERRKELGRLLG